jgi:hypothetical protein
MRGFFYITSLKKVLHNFNLLFTFTLPYWFHETFCKKTFAGCPLVPLA